MLCWNPDTSEVFILGKVQVKRVKYLTAERNRPKKGAFATPFIFISVPVIHRHACRIAE